MNNSGIMVAIAAGLSAATLFAQPRAGSQYNPQTVETVAGEVITVDRVPSARGTSGGVHLILNTGTETIAVHLGPGWYIDNQDLKIAVGDKIEVQGSRVAYEGKPAIIAATVSKGTQQLKLRNANGVPFWSSGKHK